MGRLHFGRKAISMIGKDEDEQIKISFLQNTFGKNLLFQPTGMIHL